MMQFERVGAPQPHSIAALVWLMSGAWLAGCGSPAAPSAGGMGPVAMQPCPASGPGAVTSAGACRVFSPASAGASPLGQNASRLNYALEPAGAARGTLVVLLNGSGSSPSQLTIDPSRNLFASALESGNHVLAVAYRSDVAIAQMCDSSRPDCYGASRRTLLTGVFAPGADNSLADIREDEGIIARIDQALRTLVAVRPQAGWDAFIGRPTATAPADRIAWQRIIASGHSQGGGHAAYLGKLFPLIRVVQFSSTCDAPAGVPAPWTAADSVWITSPAAAFFGFSAPTVFTDGVPTAGDLNCPYHLAVWQNLGMPPSHQADDATTCAGIDPHIASIFCGSNYPRWVALFR
jgi:hypothetical protein